MPVHHRRTSALYFIVLASAIVGLLIGSELVRWSMAALLALGAVPLWRALGRDFIARGIARAADVSSDCAGCSQSNAHQRP